MGLVVVMCLRCEDHFATRERLDTSVRYPDELWCYILDEEVWEKLLELDVDFTSWEPLWEDDVFCGGLVVIYDTLPTEYFELDYEYFGEEFPPVLRLKKKK